MSQLTDELRELDRQWAELAGRECSCINFPECTPLYSSDPGACFGRGGPWEWLVATFPGSMSLYDTRNSDYECEWLCSTKFPDEGMGSTPFEAITRCAIEAKKKLQNAIITEELK